MVKNEFRIYVVSSTIIDGTGWRGQRVEFFTSGVRLEGTELIPPMLASVFLNGLVFVVKHNTSTGPPKDTAPGIGGLGRGCQWVISIIYACNDFKMGKQKVADYIHVRIDGLAFCNWVKANRSNGGREGSASGLQVHDDMTLNYPRSGRVDDDVAHRIRAGWVKWRAASGVLCDRRIPLKLKGKFYRVAIRPAMLYGSECWPITKAQENRVEVAELRMLRWTCGKSTVDMIPNGVFRAELEVDSIIDKMREGRLRWFGHLKRRPQTAPVRRVEALLVDGSRRRGRPKLRWEDRLKQDMKELRLSEDMTSDRNAWRDRIRTSR
ncbi:hypothetical protein Tco_0723681 [Tanacetum coccineum]